MNPNLITVSDSSQVILALVDVPRATKTIASLSAAALVNGCAALASEDI